MGEGFATSPIAPKPMQGNLAPQPDAEVGEEEQSYTQKAQNRGEQRPSLSHCGGDCDRHRTQSERVRQKQRSIFSRSQNQLPI